MGLVWETLSIRPAEIFWVLEWPRVDVPGSKLAVNHCSPHSVSRSIYATPVNESRKSLKDPLVPAAETGDVYVGSDEKGFVYNSMHDKNADNTRLRRGSSFPASTEWVS